MQPRVVLLLCIFVASSLPLPIAQTAAVETADGSKDGGDRIYQQLRTKGSHPEDAS
jgi:hypothetical protein